MEFVLPSKKKKKSLSILVSKLHLKTINQSEEEESAA